MKKYMLSTFIYYLKQFIAWSMALTLVCIASASSVMANRITAKPILEKNGNTQEEVVMGTVTDKDSGDPLIGVNILLKGTTTGATTNTDGSYQITVSSLQDTLVFSYVGYKKKVVPINGQKTLDIEMESQSISGDEVVVVGYGTQKKSDLTGSVSSIPSKRLEDLPNNNFYQALQGSVPGLVINQNSAGAEGNNQSLLIRGRTSIQASNSPLIVLDGVPYEGSISEIPTNDIENISVLKDASASAIYGSRGANGVVLITTKKGSGKPKISYNGTYGIQQIANLPSTLNGDEFYKFKKIREPGSITASEEKVHKNKAGVNWVDLATQTGSRQQHTLSVSGGSDNLNYYISGGLLDVHGVAVNDKFQRVTTRANVESSITDWFTLKTNTQLAYLNRSGLDADFGGQSGAFRMNPLTTPYDSAGNLTIYPWPEDPYFSNPLGDTKVKNNDYQYSVITNNSAIINFPFLEGLEYKLNTGIEYRNNSSASYYRRKDTQRGFEEQGHSRTSTSLSNNYLIENILSFKRDFDKHNLFVTGLYSYQLTKYNSLGLTGQGYVNDALTNYQYDQAELLNPSTGYSRDALISQMLRVNYGYDSRYLITLTGRRDGYSGFGKDTKYSFFPSVALAWNVSNEEFFNSNIVNNLKFRVSYGSNGNQAVGPYQTLSRLRSRLYIFGSSTAPGYIPSQLANPVLGWESTTTLNLGLDIGLWQDRLQASVDIYNADTHDLLLDRTIPSIEGLGSITQNIGQTNNKGIDVGLTSYNIRNQDLTWSTKITASAVRNRIVSLVGDEDIINDGLFIDKPIRSNYGYVYDGVWQKNDDIANSAQPNAKPGYVKLKDINKDGQITADGDRAIQGQRDPNFVWSLGNTITYKNFSLYFFIQGQHGSKRFNPLTRDYVFTDVRLNTVKHNWWTPSNPTNEHWANDVDANVKGIELLESDAYARLKDVSLSYTLGNSWLQKTGLSNLKLYLTARNLVTITNWTGLDPELSSQRGVPLSKEFVFGVNLSL